MTPLKSDFKPTDDDIICARGRSAYNHEGNSRFRQILAGHLEKYKSATTKQQKSLVVVTILDEVQVKSRFVRSNADGKWFQVQDHIAKEKIGQGFRDLLHTRYRSSTKSKVQLRRERRRRQRDAANNAATNSPAAAGKGHTRFGSCDTLEPLPLDVPISSDGTLVFDCPLEFDTKEEMKSVESNGEGPCEGGVHQVESTSGSQHEDDNESHGKEARESSFVTPGTPLSSRADHVASDNRSVTTDASGAPRQGVFPQHHHQEGDRAQSASHYYPPPSPHRPFPPAYYHGYTPGHGSSHYYPPPTYPPYSPRRSGWIHYGPYTPPPPRRYYSPYSATDPRYSPTAVYHESLSWVRDEEKNTSAGYDEEHWGRVPSRQPPSQDREDQPR